MSVCVSKLFHPRNNNKCSKYSYCQQLLFISLKYEVLKKIMHVLSSALFFLHQIMTEFKITKGIFLKSLSGRWGESKGSAHIRS